MAGYLVSDARKVTTHRLMEMKEKGEKITLLLPALWTKPEWMLSW